MKKYFYFLLVFLLTSLMTSVNAQEWSWAYKYYNYSKNLGSKISFLNLIKTENGFKVNFNGYLSTGEAICIRSKKFKSIELTNDDIIIEMDNGVGFCPSRDGLHKSPN